MARRILIWLPSPLGDAVLSTPALRAIREKFKDARIYFLTNQSVKEVLSPSEFNDEWIITKDDSVFKLAKRLGKYGLTDSILMKNSFGAALTVLLAGIKNRIGYARDRRSLLLTEKIKPQRYPCGTYKPSPMIDYYLKIANAIGCETSNRKMELSVDESELSSLNEKIKEMISSGKPIIILVPGGAFGPSKCWPADRFAKAAMLLKEKYDASVLVSVSPNEVERKVAENICNTAGEGVISLGEMQLSLGQLKAVFSKASLVITNDTGPRHIAIALKRKVITLFGPNDPKWTETGWQGEIQIVGTADCVPCAKPNCFQERHICMESISVDSVMSAAEKMIGGEKV